MPPPSQILYTAVYVQEKNATMASMWINRKFSCHYSNFLMLYIFTGYSSHTEAAQLLYPDICLYLTSFDLTCFQHNSVRD